MNRHERRKRAIEESQRELVSEYKAIWKKADEEDREPTEDERLEVEAKMKAIEDLNGEKAEVEATLKTLAGVDELSKTLGAVTGNESGIEVADSKSVQVSSTQIKTPGQQFVESEGYKSLVEGLKRGSSQLSTGAINLDAKGTLLEETGSGLGLATPVPQVVPGVVEKLFQRLTVADLLSKGQANTSSLRYVVEGTATSGATGVAEGGAKPQSSLNLSTVDEPVKKIATTLVVSDEMLEDAAQVQSYINGRLSLFVNIEEEAEIVSGEGTNKLKGITERTGVNTWKRGTVDNNAVAIFKAINGTRGSAFLEPDAILMNPANWQTTRLLTDTAGQFFGGGPFQGPYGNGTNFPGSNQVVNVNESLWGLPVIVTTAITANTALVGCFREASQLFYRGGLTVEATNAHEDYFTKNLVAIRAEKREALAVYRPNAFVKVTELN